VSCTNVSEGTCHPSTAEAAGSAARAESTASMAPPKAPTLCGRFEPSPNSLVPQTFSKSVRFRLQASRRVAPNKSLARGRDIGASSADRALCQSIHEYHRSTSWYGNTSVTPGAATWKWYTTVACSCLHCGRRDQDNLCARREMRNEELVQNSSKD
jgi:hypothetical protein